MKTATQQSAEREAFRENAREWAASLYSDEIKRLLSEGRSFGPALSGYERAALVTESAKRKLSS